MRKLRSAGEIKPMESSLGACFVSIFGCWPDGVWGLGCWPSATGTNAAMTRSAMIDLNIWIKDSGAAKIRSNPNGILGFGFRIWIDSDFKSNSLDPKLLQSKTQNHSGSA